MNEQVKTVAGAPLFNPLAPDFIANPYPFYHRLRETEPMHLTPLGFYVASRYADIATTLRDKRFGKDFAGRMSRRHGPEILEEPVYRSMRHWMLQQDPPDHTRLRGLVVRAFTARRVEDMRPRIQEIVDGIIDRVESRGRMDLIADFAFRLPVTVICDMLGIPSEDRELFFTSSRTGGRLLDPVPLSRAEIEQHNPPIWRRLTTSIDCSSCAGASLAMISRPNSCKQRSMAASCRTRSSPRTSSCCSVLATKPP